MKRSYARENAFTMLYEKKFKPEISYAELYENALICRELEDDPYIKGVILGVAEHEEQINSMIDRFLRRWRRDRISKVALAIITLSTYEMLYMKEVPLRVSMNEAIELAKKFGDDKTRKFVNGILNSIAAIAKEGRGEDE
ncbi:MAG: transcription antitermination factor NusB [Clostridia bacterium]|nr:transcription antitermination factor NusB [Clostridia bacterium]